MANRLRALFLTMAVLATGCGDDNRLPLSPASGRVLVDGQRAAGIQVRLVPADRLDDPDALRPFAVTGDDGSFRLGTYTMEDGAPAGRYKAIIIWPMPPPHDSSDRLGGRYNDPVRSTWDVTIAVGDNVLSPFEASKPAGPAPRRGPSRSSKADAAGLD
jgi:hypothetical protein